MSTVNIKLYDMFRKNLKLQDREAKELVDAVQNVIKEQGTENLTLINKDMQSLKEHMDIKFAWADTRYSTKEDLSNTRVDMIKWMFIFWIGQIAATFGFILLFLKK